MSLLVETVRRHPLASFFVTAFAITWIAFIPFYNAGGESIAWFTFGPFVAAIIVSAMLGGWPRVKALFASIVHWRVHPVWYLIAIGFPFAVQLIANFLNPALGSSPPDWSAIPALPKIVATVAILTIFSGPLGEEPGWRGFALPRLLADHTALIASLVLGVFWALWHLPLVLLGEFGVFAALMTVVAAFVFTWLWQNTGGSVLLAILMHVSHQNSARFLGRVYSDADKLQQQWITLALWACAAVLIVAMCGTASFKHDCSRTAQPAT